jgi:hypothetical protein
MTSLEIRLQDTEAALYATLLTLREQGGIAPAPVDLNTQTATLPSSKPTRSKAEKQHGWKNLPLRTSEDLTAWFVEEQQHHTTSHSTRREFVPPRSTLIEDHQVAEAPTTASGSNLCRDQLSALDRAVSAPSDDVIERLRRCRPPNVPNTWFPAARSTAWSYDYF